jgi:Tfp pilus assembly protein PilO
LQIEKRIMDLAALKNFDVKEFFDKLKSGGFSDKKILMKFAIGFGAIVVFLIIYYSFVSPVVEEQKKQINIMNDNKAKIIQFNQNIGSLKATIKKLEPEYQKNSKLFHSKIEVEDLYQNISNFALSNGLSIVNLKKGNPVGVQGKPTTANNAAAANPANAKPIYYKIPVEYEIKGNFLGYLKFRRALSESQKVINFDKEEISILTEAQGQILSKGTVSIVGLPNEYEK